MKPVLGFAILILATFLSSTPSMAATPSSQSMTRVAFVAALRKIKPGMTEVQVKAIAGAPDDVVTEEDTAELSTSTDSYWAYGANGHIAFPVLGRIYFGKHVVKGVMGATGKPFTCAKMNETALVRLLRLIDTCREDGYIDADSYNPLPTIQIVNALQPLGKDLALDVLSEYLRVSSADSLEIYVPDNQGIFVVLRALFNVPDPPGYMRRLMIGGAIPLPPTDPKVLPRFPVMIVDDVPLLAPVGYLLGGVPEPPSMQIDYFRQIGVLRSKPLTPMLDPFDLPTKYDVESLSPDYHDQPGDSLGEGRHRRNMIARGDINLRTEILRMVGWSETFPEECYSDPAAVTPMWNSIVDKLEPLHLKWNADRQEYVSDKGGAMELPVKPHYRRYIWKPQIGQLELEVVATRREDKNVAVTCSVEHTARAGTVRLTVLDGTGTPLPSGTIDLPIRPNEGSSTQVEFALDSGTTVTLLATFEGKGVTSPTYTP